MSRPKSVRLKAGQQDASFLITLVWSPESPRRRCFNTTASRIMLYNMSARRKSRARRIIRRSRILIQKKETAIERRSFRFRVALLGLRTSLVRRWCTPSSVPAWASQATILDPHLLPHVQRGIVQAGEALETHRELVFEAFGWRFAQKATMEPDFTSTDLSERPISSAMLLVNLGIGPPKASMRLTASCTSGFLSGSMEFRP